MFIKICANTTLADAQLAAELGADAVGFVFAPSKRRVTAEQVADITEHLPASIETIGVFAMDDPYGIEHFVSGSGLTGAQLHGTFDPELVRLLSVEFGGDIRIIQTVAYVMDAKDREAADSRFEAMLRVALTEPAVWAVLLDAAKGGASGGLGTAFDWKHVAPIVRRVVDEVETVRRERPRLIVAGGLRPENVAEAIAAFAPWGVDVASGVEAEPGKKDTERLRAFITAARTAFAKLEG